jgi:beta-phosphoglucomutase
LSRDYEQAFLFDLDGVLVDTMRHHLESWRVVARELGLELSAGQCEQFRGIARPRVLEMLETLHGPISGTRREQLMERKNLLYRSAIEADGGRIAFAGAARLLKSLRLAGARIGIVSASRNARYLLRISGLLPSVDHVSDGYFPGPPKPDPAQIRDCAACLGLPPRLCAVVEDSAAGLEAARHSGALAVGIGPEVRDAPKDMWRPSIGALRPKALIARLGEHRAGPGPDGGASAPLAGEARAAW